MSERKSPTSINIWIESRGHTSNSRWSTICTMEPPPSQGRTKYPLGSISALTNCCAEAALGPPPEPLKDLSQTLVMEDISER
jgi:hypothetical protein